MLDMVFYNGIVHTIDKSGTVAEAIGLKDNKIAFVGSNREAAELEAVRKTDLKGQLVLPGFVDTHLHVMDYALAESHVKLTDCCSVAEIIETGREFLRRNGTTLGWILGRGWDQRKFTDDGRFITRKDLDKISTEYPLLYSRVCGHMAAVNSLALEKILAMEEAKGLMQYIDTENGILRESAAFIYTGLLDSLSQEEIEEFIVLGQKNLNKEGITGVHTADFLALPEDDWENILEAYKSLEKKGRLTVRTYEQCMFNGISVFEDFLKKGYRTGQGSSIFRLGPLKLLADGSLGARTALMKEPYSDDPGTSGYQVFDENMLGKFFDMADSEGMQIAVHGIGDRSIEITADLINRLNEKHQGNPNRHGIVHAQFTNTEILEKMQAGDILAYIQPVFVGSDMDIAEDRVGKQRLEKAYAWKTMADMGIKTSGGSDCPVESFSILENIYYAVTRKNSKGMPGEGWLPQEKLTVDQAVRLFTINAAYPSFEENEKGSLEPGKYADMVVVDRNIYEIAPEDIKNARVTLTVMDGKIVYEG